MESSLITKLECILKEINIYGNQLSRIDDYFEGAIDDEFLEGLPQVNLSDIDDTYLMDLIDLYGEVRHSDNKQDLNKIIKMLFKIFEDSLSIVISSYHFYYFKGEIEELKKANIEIDILIRIYSNYFIRCGYISLHEFKCFAYEFKALDCREQENIIKNLRESVNKGIGEEESLLLMYSLFYYFNKDISIANNYLAHVDKITFELINKNFLNHLEPCIKDDICKFITNKSKYNEDNAGILLADLNGYQYFNYRYYILINVCALLNSSQSILCRNYIRFIVQYDFKKLFDNLNEILSTEVILKCLKDIEVPLKYIVAWKGEKGNDDDFFSDAYSKNPEEFKRGIDLSTKKDKAYLIKFVLDDFENYEYIKILNESCISEVLKILKLKNADDVLIKNCEKFLCEEIEFNDIKKDLCEIKNRADIYSSNNQILFNALNTLIEMKDSALLKRIILVFTSIKENAYINSIYEFVIKNLGMFIELFKEYQVKVTHIITFFGFFEIYKNDEDYINYLEEQKRLNGEEDSNAYLNDKERDAINKNIEAERNEKIKVSLYILEYLKKFCDKYRENIIRNIKEVDPETRMTLLYAFNKLNTQEGIEVLLDNFNDNSILVKDYLLALFCNFENKVQYLDKVISKASSKKKNERELAVRILLKYIDYKGIDEELCKRITILLNKLLTCEKTKSIKELLIASGKVDNIEGQGIDNIITNPKTIIKDSLKFKNMNSLLWLEFDQLPKVKLKNCNEIASDDVLKAMIFIYRGQKELIRINDGDILSNLLDKNSLANFTVDIFKRWIEHKSNVKEKWVLPFTSIYGGEQGIKLIKSQLKNWYRDNKIVIEQYALTSLSILKTKEIIWFLCNYQNEYISSAIKVHIKQILYNIACDMKIVYSELFAKLIFDEEDEFILDYGNKKFIVCLNDRSGLDIFNEEGNKVRGVPKPTEDDELQLMEYKKYNTLKRKLKLQVKSYIQSLNHERGILWRSYSKEEWIIAFVNSPILRRLTYGVIWGVYNNEKLIDTFMCMKDGTFNTIDDDDFDFEKLVNSDSYIKAVPKDDLSIEEINFWQKQIEDYEIYKCVKQFE